MPKKRDRSGSEDLEQGGDHSETDPEADHTTFPEIPGGLDMSLPSDLINVDPQFGPGGSNNSECETDGTTLMTAEPSTARLILYLNPADQTQMRNAHIVGIQEDLLHMDRQQSGMVRNIHLLKRETWDLLHRTLRGDIKIAKSAPKISERCNHWGILKTRLEAVERFDKFLKYSMLDDPEYLEDRVREYAALYDLNPDETLTHVQNDIQNLKSYHTGTDALPDWLANLDIDIEDALYDIGSQYGHGVAQTVTDVALDLPYLVAPLDSDRYNGYLSVDINQISIATRLQSSIQAVQLLDDHPKEALNNANLHSQLQSRIEDPALNGRDPTPLGEDLPLELIQKPLNAANTGRAPEDRDSNPLSEIGTIVASAVGPLGNVGGVVYPLFDKGDDERHGGSPSAGSGPPPTDWLVNPLIADDNIANGWTYKQYWEWAFLLEQLRHQLDRLALDKLDSNTTTDLNRDSVKCPLCKVSPPSQFCGEDASRCGCKSYVGATRDQLDELVTYLAASYKELGAAYHLDPDNNRDLEGIIS